MTAAWTCGAPRVPAQLTLVAEGEPVPRSMCHCLACQRRTGSAFAIQARFPVERVTTEGRATNYVRISDDGEERTFSFCPDCGATVYYRSPSDPGLVAVPVGAFSDPEFPPPMISVYERRRHAWLTLPASLEHHYD